MTIKLDDEFLANTGLSELPVEERPGFFSMVRQALELRVGERLASGLSENELDEFGELHDNTDDETCRTWLESHAPDYKATVREVFDELAAELRSRADEILAVVEEQPDLATDVEHDDSTDDHTVGFDDVDVTSDLEGAAV